MIATGDIATILLRDLKSFGIDTYKKGAIPGGEITTERITINPKEPAPGTYWKKGFVDINICVPDVDGLANTARLTELERLSFSLRSVSSFDDSTYRYSVYSTIQEQDTALKCHFVNVKILFEVLNVK